jgi:hypothetical protein
VRAADWRPYALPGPHDQVVQEDVVTPQPDSLAAVLTTVDHLAGMAASRMIQAAMQL